jgi:pimeloyl-ACP methyl ester carboxylesterase
VTVDRPGAGLSDFQPKRTLLDWPTDVAALADALRWDSFAIVAHSGAGPHALACAHLLGKRVRQVSLVSGFSPIDRPGATDGMADQMRKGIWLLRRLPFLASLMLRPLPARYREDARAAFNAQFGQGLPEADVAALAEPALASAVHTAAAEAFRQGSAGAALEMLLFLSRPWGFEPEDVRSRVRLWYGTADTVVPIGMGRALANALPNSELTELPNAGHMAFLEHWEAILREAAAA